MRILKYKKEILIFILLYALFSLGGFLFPIDREWYASLEKPSWTPDGSVIGMIWAVLFALISLAVVIFGRKTGWSKEGLSFYVVLAINYLTNQAFSYFQFKQKDLWLATVDCFFVALTALLLILISMKKSKPTAALLVPYLLWTSFATYLSYTIYSLNL